jgi:hypothetical protein
MRARGSRDAAPYVVVRGLVRGELHLVHLQGQAHERDLVEGEALDLLVGEALVGGRERALVEGCDLLVDVAHRRLVGRLDLQLRAVVHLLARDAHHQRPLQEHELDRDSGGHAFQRAVLALLFRRLVVLVRHGLLLHEQRAHLRKRQRRAGAEEFGKPSL